jgi:DNA invertase Pin-like site-specific DNA recombinase
MRETPGRLAGRAHPGSGLTACRQPTTNRQPLNSSNAIRRQQAVQNCSTGRAQSTHACIRTYLGRKPTYSREQLAQVQELLGRQTIGIAAIAKDTGLTRQTVYRIKEDPAGAEAAMVAWEAATAKTGRTPVRTEAKAATG